MTRRAIETTPDHVAVAVPALEAAAVRWREELGGAWWSRFHYPGRFLAAQLRYHGGAKLELLAPSPQDDGSGFLPRFLGRHGAGVHHVTLKVPAMPPALEALAAAGLDAVDVDLRHPAWQEAFLRPSQVGGLVVQVAASDRTDEQWAASFDDGLPEPPPAAGPRLLGPLLGHPDLSAAAATWTVLGGHVDEEDGGLLVRWPEAPLTVRIVPAERPGPIALRFAAASGGGTTTAGLPGDAAAGPPVVVEP